MREHSVQLILRRGLFRVYEVPPEGLLYLPNSRNVAPKRAGLSKPGRQLARQVRNVVQQAAAAQPPRRKKSNLFGKMFRALGVAAGAAAGGAFGGVPGAALGATLAGDTLSLGTATGRGDYYVQGPLTQQGLMTKLNPGTRAPTFHGDSIIQHREFICDIKSSSDFNVTSFPLNPGLPTTFPWLSGVAAQYEKYEFLGLIFEFVTTSSAIAANSPALGSVSMATNYDARDPTFVSKQQIESYEFSISGSPCRNLVHMIECGKGSMAREGNYIRTPVMNSTVEGAGIQLYDVGNFQIATQGMSQEYTIGELYVTYKVRLLRPRVVLSVGGLTQMLYYTSDPAYGTHAGCETEYMLPHEKKVFDNLNTPGENVFSLVENTNRLLFSQAGRYYITIHWENINADAAFGFNPIAATDPTNVAVSDVYSSEQVSGGAVRAALSFVIDVSKSGTSTSNMVDMNITASTGVSDGTWHLRLYESPV